MTELVLEGKGGAELDPREMLTDELIGLVEGLNPNLGTEKDPYFAEYTSFMSEIQNLGIAMIDADTMTNGRFDEMDLSGKEEETKDLPDNLFQFEDVSHFTDNQMMAMALALTWVSPLECVEEDGYFFPSGIHTPFGVETLPTLQLKK